MKVSYRWLAEWVDFTWSPQELASRLTMVGLEVESLEEITASFRGVISAQIQAVEKHPSADNLSLCIVNTGKEVLKIVCGATNMAPGNKVPLALPGARLANDTVIEGAEVRGIYSEGMLCSEKELGLSEDQSGLMILEPHIALGAPLAELLDLRDWVLEIGITPNRGDCLSIVGIAREVAALANQPLIFPSYRLVEMGPPIKELTSVVIQDLDLCPRYACRVLQDIKIGPSPWWMRKRLSALGMRPINNIVDATNYVMLELGQPLHAFDYDLLQENRIVVRRAGPGEKIVTLDGVERTLAPEMLVIADARDPVAVGGVMGGSTSEVNDHTRRVLLESAYFSPTGTRKTSKGLGLTSEASYRFERGVDPWGTMQACDRAAYLMRELAGGQIAGGYIDAGFSSSSLPRLSLRVKRANAFLGISLAGREQAEILKRLNFEVTSKGRGQYTVKVPSWRPDITREADLWEEIARYYGYDRIPSTLPGEIYGEATPGPQEKLEENLRRLLVSLGFSETVSFSFTNPKVFAKLGLTSDNPLTFTIPLKNPLSEEEGYLRTLLLPHLLEAASRNLNQNQKSVKIFEIARTFHPRPGEPLPHEQRELLAAAAGEWAEKHWSQEARKVDFYDLKGVWERIGESMGLDWELSSQPAGKEEVLAAHSYLNPGRTVVVLQKGQPVGFLGELKKSIKEAFDIAKDVYILELNLDVLQRAPEILGVYKPLPRYPAVVRDVALVVPENLSAREILEHFRRWGGEWVEEVKVFDCYQGEAIPPGKKSLAFSIQYRVQDRTLRDEEVNQYHSRIVAAVIQETGAVVRA
jgi:phenylalanyl-tRNA synthetase beta chain